MIIIENIFIPTILLLVFGPFAGIFLAITLELGYFLIRGRKNQKDMENRSKMVKKFVLFLILFVLSEIALYLILYPILDFQPLIPEGPAYTDSFPDTGLKEGIIWDYNMYEPIDTVYVVTATTLLGLFVYSFVQIPFSIYLFIKKDRERGKRAIIRFLVFLGIGVLGVLLLNL